MPNQAMPTGCTIVLYRDETATLAVLSGALRLQNSEPIRQQITSMLDQGIQDCYVYLAQLQMIDSSGLGMLVGLHMTARKKKINFCLLAPTADHVKLFDVTRLSSILNLISGAQAGEIWDRLAREENRFTLPPGDV